MKVQKEELRRIGVYTESLTELRLTLLTDAERLDLRELLKKWLAEVEEKPITVKVSSSWGDVRRLNNKEVMCM